MNTKVILTAAVLSLGLGAVLCGTAHAAATVEAQSRWYHVKAKLRSDDDHTIKGKVQYRERVKRDEHQRRVQVKIQRGDADTVYDVLHNGEVIGMIETNEDGQGKLFLRTYRAPRGRWDVMPDDFPMLLEGDVIQVGAASGDVREK